MSKIIEDKKVSEILNSFWDNASNSQKNKVKTAGDYSYYQTIRTSLEKGRFSERMIKAFIEVIDSKDLNDILKNKSSILQKK